MSRLWVWGILAVSIVAGLKTFLIWHFAFADKAADWGVISAFFALFFALTTMVAYFSFMLIRRHMSQQRKIKLTPGKSEPIAKETVVLRYAADWGLSQAQADVAIFVAKGFSNNEIADMRGCAVATVKSQLGAIYQKSGLESRYQLIAFVTDEVCAMAQAPAAAQVIKRQTKDALPLVGRARSDA